MTALMFPTLVGAQQSATSQTENQRPHVPPTMTPMDVRLAALSQLETNDRDNPPGADISRYGISPRVWHEYAGLLPLSAATNQLTAKRIATKILQDRIESFVASYGRQPTEAQVYLLWYRPARVMHPTKRDTEKAQRFSNLCSQ